MATLGHEVGDGSGLHIRFGQKMPLISTAYLAWRMHVACSQLKRNSSHDAQLTLCAICNRLQIQELPPGSNLGLPPG
jgi:hypothetical protein